MNQYIVMIITQQSPQTPSSPLQTVNFCALTLKITCEQACSITQHKVEYTLQTTPDIPL